MYFCIFFGRAGGCWLLLCLCRPFWFIFERCLDSNPECCRSKRARYQLRHTLPWESQSLVWMVYPISIIFLYCAVNAFTSYFLHIQLFSSCAKEWKLRREELFHYRLLKEGDLKSILYCIVQWVNMYNCIVTNKYIFH